MIQCYLKLIEVLTGYPRAGFYTSVDILQCDTAVGNCVLYRLFVADFLPELVTVAIIR